MSMITGCPACGTMFRVVPDQLKISEGWVRCGHCGEVFDAAASLKPEPPGLAEAPVDAQAAEPPAVDASPPSAAVPAEPPPEELKIDEIQFDRPAEPAATL